MKNRLCTLLMFAIITFSHLQADPPETSELLLPSESSTLTQELAPDYTFSPGEKNPYLKEEPPAPPPLYYALDRNTFLADLPSADPVPTKDSFPEYDRNQNLFLARPLPQKNYSPYFQNNP